MRGYPHRRALLGIILPAGLLIALLLIFVVRGTQADQTSLVLNPGDTIDLTCETGLSGTVSGSQATIQCAAPAPTAVPASPTILSMATPQAAVASTIHIEAEDAIQFGDSDDVNSGGVYRTDGLDVELCAACDRGNGGYTVGWIADGEWVEYQTHIVAEGSYQIRLRSAVPNYGRLVGITLNGMDIGMVELPFTGSYNSYVDVDSVPFMAGIGQTTIRLLMPTGAFNLDMLQVIPLEVAAPPPTSTAVPSSTAVATALPSSTALPTSTALPAELPTATPVPTSVSGNSSQGVVWQRWEQRLQASTAVSDPYHRLQVQATFTGPDGSSFRVAGFWDGDQTMVVRTMFPSAGTWSWSTTSTPADAGLTQSGTVVVAPASSANPLTAHGRLVVGPTQRYLAHADGTPFFWLADTAWAATVRISDDEWLEYLDTRIAQGFSAIQISLAPTWSATTDRQGRAPFVGTGISQPNPAFWEGMASKIAVANNRGLVVMVVGLADPLDELITPGAEVQYFAGQLAARLAGDHVLLAPSFDRPYLPEMDAVGAAIRAAVPQALITQHPGTPSGQPTNIWAEAYANQPYMSVYGNQTGHNGGDRALVNSQAVAWNLSLWRAQTTRPVLNLEAFYDANGTGEGLGGYRSGTAAEVRSTSYLSLLSGASGYTYGAFGVWGWERDPQAANYWRNGLTFPSATQMGVLRAVFAAQPWWTLVPQPERIVNPASGAQIMALASSPDGRLTMAYLPDNPTIAIQRDGLAATLRVTWVNPSTGEQIDGGLVSGSGIGEFARPGAGDWLLILADSR